MSIKNEIKYRNSKSKSHPVHIPKSPLTDNPPIGSEYREVNKDYIRHYESTNERIPSYTYLNKRYGLRATKAFYDTLKH